MCRARAAASARPTFFRAAWPMPAKRRSRRYCAGPRHYYFTERMNERMSTALPGGSTSQGGLLPTSWFPAWWPSGASSTPAPQNFEQPILPGWICSGHT